MMKNIFLSRFETNSITVGPLLFVNQDPQRGQDLPASVLNSHIKSGPCIISEKIYLVRFSTRFICLLIFMISA